ncbi:hypothetical protein HZC00_02735 [Candidatus Kaiserbacteria bacterium]|nr:hypothetical protein [Candidatus Kaiserbacteria bacterium]
MFKSEKSGGEPQPSGFCNVCSQVTYDPPDIIRGLKKYYCCEKHRILLWQGAGYGCDPKFTNKDGDEPK